MKRVPAGACLAAMTALALMSVARGAQPQDNPAPVPGQAVSFLACPVFRNTPVERGCWLSRWQGRLYFIGHRPLVGPGAAPQLLHQVLVEGVIADEPDACGGIVIHPVSVSVIREIDKGCNEILPSEGHAPSPSSSAEAAAMLIPDWGRTPESRRPRPGPSDPQQPATFTVRFDFDSSFVTAINRGPVANAAAFAKASRGKVNVTAYSVDSRLSDGAIARESAERARDRAELLAESLRRLGVPADAIVIHTVSESRPQGGAEAPSLRRATIEVTPT